MVHRGPSRGCQSCKNRHIRCDEQRPACEQCLRRDISCPGYKTGLEIVLRDQTAKVAAQNTRKPQEKALKLRKAELCVARASPPVQAPLSIDFVDVSLTFLFSNYANASDREFNGTHGRLNFFPALFPKKEALGSALGLATAWLAVAMFSEMNHMRNLALEKGLWYRSIQRIRMEVCDPVKALDDDTLAAVVMLQFGLNIACWHVSRRPTLLHQAGAAALIKKRGLNNFQSETSKWLLVAVRSATAASALFGHADPMDPALWTDHVSMPQTMATRLDKLIYRLAFLRSRALDPSSGNGSEPSLLEDTLELYDDMISWRDSVPASWGPFCLSTDPAFPELSTYRAQSIHYVYNQWRCLMIAVIRLLQYTTAETDDIAPTISGMATAIPGLLNDIRLAIQRSVGLAKHQGYISTSSSSNQGASDHKQLPLDGNINFQSFMGVWFASNLVRLVPTVLMMDHGRDLPDLECDMRWFTAIDQMLKGLFPGPGDRVGYLLGNDTTR